MLDVSRITLVNTYGSNYHNFHVLRSCHQFTRITTSNATSLQSLQDFFPLTFTEFVLRTIFLLQDESYRSSIARSWHGIRFVAEFCGANVSQLQFNSRRSTDLFNFPVQFANVSTSRERFETRSICQIIQSRVQQVVDVSCGLVRHDFN